MGKYKYDDWDDDVLVPYKSKSKKKGSKKSDHKHIYNRYIGVYYSDITNNDRCIIIDKCNICDKIDVVNYFITIPVPNKPLRKLTSSLSEIKEFYPDLEVIRIKEVGCSYVCE